MKKPLFFVLVLVLWVYQFTDSSAKTIDITANPIIDYSFTKDYKLTYKNYQYEIGKGFIKPIIKTNIETDLSNINHISVIGDNQYFYKFYVDIKDVSLSAVNYVGFNLTGFKKYDEISFTDGIIRVIFDDLKDKGELSLKDNQIILNNPTTLKLDPIIELIPNTTNKAYYNSTSNIWSCSNFGNGSEFTQNNYNQVNTSNNIYYGQTAFTSLTAGTKCNYFFYTFNITPFNVNVSGITTMNITHEGYYFSLLDSYSELYYLNASSNKWVYLTEMDMTDKTRIFNFSSKFNQLISSQNITTFGVRNIAIITDRQVVGYTDYASLKINYFLSGETTTTTTTTSTTTTETTTTSTLPTTTTVTPTPTTSTTTTSTTTTSTTTTSTTTTTLQIQELPQANLYEIMIYSNQYFYPEHTFNYLFRV